MHVALSDPHVASIYYGNYQHPHDASYCDQAY